MTKRRSTLDIVLSDQKNLSIQEGKRGGRSYLLGLMTAFVVALGLASIAQADDALIDQLMNAGLSKGSVVKASKLIGNKENNVCTVLVKALVSQEIVGNQAVKFTDNACSDYEIHIEENERKRIEGYIERIYHQNENMEKRLEEAQGINN